MNRRRMPIVGTALATLMLALLPSTVLATASITFWLDSYSPNCVTGHAPANQMLDFVWRDSAAGLKAKATGIPVSGSGYWTYCAAESATVATHDVLKATVGSTTRSFTVPPFSVVVDRVANDFHGDARPNTTVDLYYVLGMFADYFEHVEVAVDSAGHWSFRGADDPEYGYVFDIDGAGAADLEWTSPHGDMLATFAVAPMLKVTIGSSQVSGDADEGNHSNIVLRNGTTNAWKAKATTRQGGYFQSKFRNASGHLVSVAVGDHVVATGLAADADWYVPDSGATANVATDLVTGFCEDRGISRSAIVRIFRTGHLRGFGYVYAEPNGQFEIDFSGHENLGFDPANIKHGDRIQVSCELSVGDWVQQSFRVP